MMYSFVKYLSAGVFAIFFVFLYAMNRKALAQFILQQQSYLCVGLDTDLSKLPPHLKGDANAIVTFNKAIIEATKDYCVSYKINTAFYESLGAKGWDLMAATLSFIPDTHFTIADAKRGDIGNTSHQYAKTFFETLNFDAVTVAPYMGEDSIKPFLEFENKWTIVLGLTSNNGASNFQHLYLQNGKKLYQEVLETVSTWGTTDNLMFVVGATQAIELQNIRKYIPAHFLLVPGVGFQGGSLQQVHGYGANDAIGLLVNVSRAILYASSTENFAQEAALIAAQYQSEMKTLIETTLTAS